jgi:ribosomal protein L32E
VYKEEKEQKKKNFLRETSFRFHRQQRPAGVLPRWTPFL